MGKFSVADYEKLFGALVRYGQHEGECILSKFEEYDPTTRGLKYLGIWYDNEPDCECGLDVMLGLADAEA